MNYFDEEFEYGKHCQESGSESGSEWVDIRRGCGNTMIHFYFKSVILLLMVVWWCIDRYTHACNWTTRMHANVMHQEFMNAYRIITNRRKHAYLLDLAKMFRPFIFIAFRSQKLDFCMPSAEIDQLEFRKLLLEFSPLFSEWWRWN